MSNAAAGSGDSRDMVDWDLAVATATRLVRPGPNVSRDDAHRAVADLRELAVVAQEEVRKFTGLDASAGSDGVAIIDRPGWVRVNVDGFRMLLHPLVDKLRERQASGSASMSGLTGTVGPKVTGVETGVLLAYLSSKVLGQYELFGTNGDEAPGRLLLVAPNIVHAEQEMGVDSRDFRLWVCIHEETHRTQFGAVPWLREHLIFEIQAFLGATEVDPSALARRLRDAVGVVTESVRGEGDRSLLDVVQTDEQREILDRLTAVMSLLEGHADYVMDGVGPEVIPSVAEIRRRFQKRRRQGSNPLDQVIRRLLGVEAKIRQYADGVTFVRGVVDEVGMEGFNRVWGSPRTLPTRAEIADPPAWVRRIVTDPPALPA
jgi:coenzyme F420 biosynthesis associated uncharacterized protein